MISLKNLAGLLLCGGLLVSCTPAYPPGHRPDMPHLNPNLGPNPPHEKTIAQLERELAERKAEEKRRARARERSIEAAARERVARDTPPVTNPTTPDSRPPVGNPVKPKKNYPVARRIPGKSGFVYNPYNNNPVDVRGMPSGALAIDPSDPNKATNRFRLP